MKRLLFLFSIAILAFPLFWSCSEKEIPVASVTLSQPAAEMFIGESITLKAIISPSDATVIEVIWASSKQSVASVDQSGKVVAIAEGTSTITATVGGKMGSCVVTVSKKFVDVSSINLDKTSASLKVGEKVTLTATVKPDDATDKTVTWSTSDASVATVDNGVVTAIKLGSATITAKAGDKKATCTITVEATPVTSITLDKTSASLKVGETVTFVATVKPDDATDKMVTWSTSDASVATVDQNGKVTALSKGKTTIMSIAHDGSGYSASCSVIVSSPCPIGAVDLGMTTSEGYNLYWATCNVCETGFVSSPEEVGDYYAWGEVEPYYSSQDPLTWKDGKTGYIWDSYKWCNGREDSLTKYNTSAWRGTVDNKTVLEAEDDVVHVKLGGSWRMPTVAEWTELRENCTWTWTTQNGVNGRLVTSNKNGNSIFLPAAGTWVGPVFYGAGSNGYYWSSSLSTDASDSALDVNFNSSYVSWSNPIRCAGRSVRPVCE